MIKNGIIQDKEIKGVKVLIDLIPKTNNYGRPAYDMSPTSITIHETANKRKGADAKAHTEYVDNVSNYVSWHFTVDDKEIYQEIPINENAWHAGDGGKGKGNRTSIAIEICVNEDGDFEKAKENTRILVQYLMQETGIKNIVPHKHWSGKNCPMNILSSGWDEFLNWLHVDIDKDNEYDIIKSERDYYKQKFEELYQWVTEIKEYGGY